MVIAYHVIISAYGFWLPNDPRGSWSESVRKFDLLRYGQATKVDTRESVAAVPHDVALREEAKAALDYPPVSFTGLQAAEIGNGFAEYVRKSRATIWACAILPEHIHLVVKRHRYKIEHVVNLMKGESTKRLMETGLHPFSECPYQDGSLPPCWARNEWKVFIFTVEHLEAAIRYVEENPVKEGKHQQKWSFVVPYPKTYDEIHPD